MFRELNNLSRCLRMHIRRNILRIHIRWIPEPRRNYLSTRIHNLRKLPPILNIMSKGYPILCKLEFRIDKHMWHHNSRWFMISNRHHRVSILNRLVSILNHKFSNLRRNLKVKARASVFNLCVIIDFSINRPKSLMNLTLTSLMVVIINHMRRMMNGHAPWERNRFPNSRRHNKRLVQNRSTSVSELRSIIGRHPLRIESNMPTRTNLKDMLTYNRLNHNLNWGINNDSTINNSSSNNGSISDNNNNIRISRGSSC